MDIANNESASLDERVAATATLLSNRKPEAVAIVADIAEKYGDEIPTSPPPFSKTNPGPLVMTPGAFTISGALSTLRNRDSKDSLVRIAESKAELWRAGALNGLRNLHDPSTVPIFIRALDDSDSFAQYIGVISLSELTGKGGEYGPGMGPFKTNRQKYIQLWKRWWDTEAKAQYGSP